MALKLLLMDDLECPECDLVTLDDWWQRGDNPLMNIWQKSCDKSCWWTVYCRQRQRDVRKRHTAFHPHVAAYCPGSLKLDM